MPTDHEIEAKLWAAIRSDRTILLGLEKVEHGLGQPMTALLEEGAERGPLWIFTSKETDLVKALGARAPSTVHFASKNHAVFATLTGKLVADNDKAVIERLWNPFVAAWYEKGKDDPKLQLLRFDPDHARIWLNENSLFAGIKLLLGRDPKKDYEGKIADIQLT